MKRKLFVIAFALVAVIGTAVAALLPAPTATYVYSTSSPSGALTFAGTFDISNSGSATVTIRIFDQSQNAFVLRTAYDVNGVPLKNSNAITFESDEIVP